MSDEKLKAAFEDGSLDPETFNHALHLRLGWLYLRDNPTAQAIDKFTQALRDYTVHVGAEAKYHQTITWWYLLIMSERQARGNFTNFNDFLAQNRDLLAEGAPVLTQYYCAQTLASDFARKHFAIPDALNFNQPQ